MKCLALCVCLTSAELAACAYLPTAGPTAGEVIDQGLQDNRIRYDVVDINHGVVERERLGRLRRREAAVQIAAQHNDAKNLGSRSALSAWLASQFRRRRHRIEGFE